MNEEEKEMYSYWKTNKKFLKWKILDSGYFYNLSGARFSTHKKGGSVKMGEDNSEMETVDITSFSPEVRYLLDGLNEIASKL